MQANMPGASGAVLFLLWLFTSLAVVGYVILLVALWRAMRAHESIAQAVLDIARHLERPQTPKHDVDRFTFGE